MNVFLIGLAVVMGLSSLGFLGAALYHVKWLRKVFKDIPIVDAAGLDLREQVPDEWIVPLVAPHHGWDQPIRHSSERLSSFVLPSSSVLRSSAFVKEQLLLQMTKREPTFVTTSESASLLAAQQQQLEQLHSYRPPSSEKLN